MIYQGIRKESLEQRGVENVTLIDVLLYFSVDTQDLRHRYYFLVGCFFIFIRRTCQGCS